MRVTIGWRVGKLAIESCANRSRRRHTMPKRSAAAAVEAQVLAVRDKHPAWGSSQDHHCLKRDWKVVPAPSTAHRILSRNDQVKPSENAPPNPGHHFEKEAPNQLWQMDFKGHMSPSDPWKE